MEAARLAAYFVPGIGSALSASDASRAFGAKDILGGSLSALGTIPMVGGLLKLAGFAGKGSKIGSGLNNIGNNVFKYGIDLPAKLIAKALGAAGKPITSAAKKLVPTRPASGGGRKVTSAPGASVSTANQMDAAIDSMTNKQLKQAAATMYNRKDIEVDGKQLATYSIGQDANRFTFEGPKEHLQFTYPYTNRKEFDPSIVVDAISKSLKAPASVVYTTPTGLLEAALKINPENKQAQALLDNFQQNKLGQNEVEFLRDIAAAISVGKNGKMLKVERTDGLAEVLAAISGNPYAQKLLAFKKEKLNAKFNDTKERDSAIYAESRAYYADAYTRTLPVALDTLPFVRSLKHKPVRNEDGSVDLFAASQYIDYPRASLHGTIHDTVKSHESGKWFPTETKVIASMADAVDRNGLPYSMASYDTWWMLNPGQPFTLSNPSIISVYDDLFEYTEELLKRGLIQPGQKPPMIARDDSLNDVLHFWSKENDYSRLQVPSEGFDHTPELIEQKLADLAIDLALDQQKMFNVKRNYLTRDGLLRPEGDAEIRATADMLGVKTGRHSGTKPEIMETPWTGFDYNSVGTLDDITGEVHSRALYSDSIEAFLTNIWKGKLLPFQKDLEAYRFNMLRKSGIRLPGDSPEGATGGYISGSGTGTSDSITAKVSNGEYVMSAKSVDTYGVDFMNALNQSRVMYAPAQPSMVQSGGGSSVVYLSPDDRALLRAAIDRPVNLYADSTRLAQSVNNGNKVLAQRGSI
jgi:hypothetical protein